MKCDWLTEYHPWNILCSQWVTLNEMTLVGYIPWNSLLFGVWSWFLNEMRVLWFIPWNSLLSSVLWPRFIILGKVNMAGYLPWKGLYDHWVFVSVMIACFFCLWQKLCSLVCIVIFSSETEWVFCTYFHMKWLVLPVILKSENDWRRLKSGWGSLYDTFGCLLFFAESPAKCELRPEDCFE